MDDVEETVSFLEAAQFAIRLNRVRDTFPDEYRPDVGRTDLYDWARELLPYYENEGATGKVTIPRDIEFFQFWDQAHDRVGGRSNCETKAVVNLRFSNDHSAWYRDIGVVATLAHELAHVQQGDAICSEIGDKTSEERAIIENTAPIVS